MQRLFAMLPSYTARKPQGVPAPMTDSYKAQNRNVAVIMFRETMAGRA